jgi:hypothetical protein
MGYCSLFLHDLVLQINTIILLEVVFKLEFGQFVVMGCYFVATRSYWLFLLQCRHNMIFYTSLQVVYYFLMFKCVGLT